MASSWKQIVFALITGCASSVWAQTPVTTDIPDVGDLKLQISAAKDANKKAEELIRASKVYEELVTELNDELALPGDITISFKEDDDGPHYNNREIVMNWDIVTEHLEMFGSTKAAEDGKGDNEDAEAQAAALHDPAAVKAALQSIEFIFYHELGHALIDAYDLPVLGKEEDAVDSLAAIIAIELKQDPDIAVAGADAFKLWAGDRQGFDDAEFYDEHSLNEQRFFSTVCLLYGSDPKAHAGLLAEVGMDKDREDFCEQDYEQKSKSWETVLDPYLKGEAEDD